MNKLLQEAVRFRIPFTENYTLTSQTNIKSSYFDMQTKTKIRWALRVIAIAENGDAEIELLTLEHLMVDTNNENLQDIITLNQVFSRMYSELHLIINIQGEVIKIINLEHIKNKWEETKTQLLKIKQQEPALLQMLTIKDEIFSSADKIKIAIENNEFFKHYFGKIYGNKLPVARKTISQNNVLQTADTEWLFKFNHRPEFDTVHLENIIIKYRGEAIAHQTDWKTKAYGHLPDIDIKKLDPVVTEEGSYRSNFKSGKLHLAETKLTEIALPGIIEATINYRIESDAYKSNENNIQNQSYNDTPYRIID
ncbi:hypothetical protein ASF10_23150 [Flavobacterium sp. Leaf82]|jgi:hypothetical protein|uniref:hypothetical protein n=1 Tax=Flavobacterium sp. Leaf82 TaxID=1736238 RepID=UPI0006F1F42E|nr:hypothetical protein [Flavobacterium sp. Leaf82]KQO27910.1 hypothetical protein ASF10_23150 [Flavobacterium sp. Leaf82]